MSILIFHIVDRTREDEPDDAMDLLSYIATFIYEIYPSTIEEDNIKQLFEVFETAGSSLTCIFFSFFLLNHRFVLEEIGLFFRISFCSIDWYLHSIVYQSKESFSSSISILLLPHFLYFNLQIDFFLLFFQ